MKIVEYIDSNYDLFDESYEAFIDVVWLCQGMRDYYAIGTIYRLYEEMQKPDSLIFKIDECQEVIKTIMAEGIAVKDRNRDSNKYEWMCWLVREVLSSKRGEQDLVIDNLGHDKSVPYSPSTLKKMYKESRTTHGNRECPICHTQNEQAIFWFHAMNYVLKEHRINHEKAIEKDLLLRRPK